jgi:hypothetical protein
MVLILAWGRSFPYRFGVLFVALCLLRRVASKGLPGLLLRGLPDAYFGPVGPMAKEKAGRPMED